jgi:hypothetical protein
MTRMQLRLCAGMAVAAATMLLLFVHATALAPAASASWCCEACDSHLDACYNACSQISHSGGSDSGSKCLDDCDNYAINHCYKFCVWCNQSNPPIAGGSGCIYCYMAHAPSSCTVNNDDANTCLKNIATYHWENCSSIPNSFCW